MLSGQDIKMRIQSRWVETVTPVVQAAAYSAGNAVGGLITLGSVQSNVSKGPPIEQPGLSTILDGIVVVDKDAQSKALVLFLFDALPTTPVDKTAYAPTQADLQKLIAVVPILAADYVAINSMSYASYYNLGRILKPVNTLIYGALYTGASGTPTFTTTSSLQLKLMFRTGT